MKNHFYVIALEGKKSHFRPERLGVEQTFLETTGCDVVLACVCFVSLQCCPAGFVFTVQLQVWFRSSNQPLAALLNAESQGIARDTNSTQTSAVLVAYLLKTRDPPQITFTSVVDQGCFVV